MATPQNRRCLLHDGERVEGCTDGVAQAIYVVRSTDWTPAPEYLAEGLVTLRSHPHGDSQRLTIFFVQRGGIIKVTPQERGVERSDDSHTAIP